MHKVTHEELILSNASLGFNLDNLTKLSSVDFINRSFPGINVYQLLKELNSVLAPITSSRADKIITLQDPPPILDITFQYIGPPGNGKTLKLRRTFSYDPELIVSHDYFYIPPSARQKGIGKTVLESCLKQYENMDVKRIKVHAGLEDGGYVWAKAGFKATNYEEVNLILEVAKDKLKGDDLSDVVDIHTHYYQEEPKGNKFPMEQWARLDCMKDILRGSDWHGQIDLTNPNEKANFKNYVSKRR